MMDIIRKGRKGKPGYDGYDHKSKDKWTDEDGSLNLYKKPPQNIMESTIIIIEKSHDNDNLKHCAGIRQLMVYRKHLACRQIGVMDRPLVVITLAADTELLRPFKVQIHLPKKPAEM